jgi:hypothetical protein
MKYGYADVWTDDQSLPCNFKEEATIQRPGLSVQDGGPVR